MIHLTHRKNSPHIDLGEMRPPTFTSGSLFINVEEKERGVYINICIIMLQSLTFSLSIKSTPAYEYTFWCESFGNRGVQLLVLTYSNASAARQR